MRVISVFTLLLFSITSCYPPPPPNFEEMRRFNLEEDRAYWEVNQCTLPDRPLTYCEIITLVLSQNFDLLLKSQEYAVQREMATGERLALLPELNLNLESYHRSNLLTVTSQSIQTGQVTVIPSIASRRDQFRTNIEGVLSLVDFGLTYFRWRQATDESYIKMLQLQRLTQTTILEATRAYWNALIYQKMFLRFSDLVQQTMSMNDALDLMIETQSLNSTDALIRQRRLLELQNDILYYEDLYVAAKKKLAGLMGIPASQYYELEDIEFAEIEFEDFDIEKLEELALLNRPELMEKDVDQRISKDTVYSRIVEMIPNFRANPAHRTYDNPFYKYNLWWDVAFSTTWNLLALPSKYAFYKSAKADVVKEKIDRLSVSIGILTQVNIAYISYLQSLRDYQPANRLASVSERLKNARLREIALGVSSGYEVLQSELESFLDLVERWVAFADVQIALEELASSIGMPLSLSPFGKTFSLPNPSCP